MAARSAARKPCRRGPAGVEPVTDMNPVLLKPQSEGGAQIIVDGRVWGSATAAEYRNLAPSLLPRVLAAFGRLAEAADLVLVEGAGSPAEINLRAGDIANMGFAEAADVPVVLIGDIERGGVIAQLVGTHLLLSQSERALIAGYIVNKFRGDTRLFEGGIAAIGERTQWRSFGVVPYFAAAELLPAEDLLALAHWKNPPPKGRGRRDAGERVKIAVPVLPRIANFDDLDPLRAEPDVEIVMVQPGRPLPRDAALVILPGSKATIADLAFLRAEGWDIDILAHRRQGGRVLGLCGGYQMLGRTISDPLGIEGRREEVRGLGLLDIDTVLGAEKRLRPAAGVDVATGMPVTGYEMHLGETTGPGLATPDVAPRPAPRRVRSAPTGSSPGAICTAFLPATGSAALFLKGSALPPANLRTSIRVETTLDALADHLERHLDLSALLAAARPPAPGQVKRP